MDNPILYIVLNKSLKMSGGKGAAQAVHAAMSLENRSEKCVNGIFANYNRRTVIVLEANDESQLRNLKEYLAGAGLKSEYYIDEGMNEVSAYSLTALAVEPIDEDDERRDLFAEFNLFSGYDPRDDRDRCEIAVAEAPTNDFREAHKYLEMINHYTVKTPRYLKKTIKWLREQR